MNNKIFEILDINGLNQAEKVLEYLYFNGIDRSNFYEHENEISAFFSTHEDYLDFLEFFIETKSFINVDKAIPENDSVKIFLHPKFHRDPFHIHDFFELKYLIRGNATLFIDDHAIRVEKSNFCLIAPSTLHHTEIFDEESTMINFIIRKESVFSAFRRLFIQENTISDFFIKKNSMDYSDYNNFIYIKTNEDKNIENLILLAFNQGRTSPVLLESITENILLYIVNHFCDNLLIYNRNTKNNKKIYKILMHIKENMSSINFSDLSKHFNYSETYMSRFIKESTGQTFSSILKNYKIMEAENLLRNSNLNVSQIMQKVGYSGKTYFYGIFHEKYGMTPHEYMKKYKIKR